MWEWTPPGLSMAMVRRMYVMRNGEKDQYSIRTIVQQKRAHGSAIKHSAVRVPSLPCPATMTRRIRHAELASISCCSCTCSPACVRLRLRFPLQVQSAVEV